VAAGGRLKEERAFDSLGLGLAVLLARIDQSSNATALGPM
jgi:hypothetical protein